MCDQIRAERNARQQLLNRWRGSCRPPADVNVERELSFLGVGMPGINGASHVEKIDGKEPTFFFAWTQFADLLIWQLSLGELT